MLGLPPQVLYNVTSALFITIGAIVAMAIALLLQLAPVDFKHSTYITTWYVFLLCVRHAASGGKE